MSLPLDFNPWSALTGETQPTITFEKRGRGRPRKHNLPVSIEKRKHTMGDSEIQQAKLSLTERKQMVEFFKLQRELSDTLQEALKVTAVKFKITYAKAYDDLGDYF